MKHFKIIIALIFCILIVGCKQKNALNTEIENDIKFDSITVNEKYHILGDSTNPYCMLESSFIFPSEYKDKDMLDKLNIHFINSFFGEDTASVTPREAMDRYVEKYITDYKELESDFISETEILGKKPSQESWFAYYEMSSNEIIYNKCNLLSYTISVEYYTGGAHGGHGYNNYVLNLNTGEELDETDIFIENYHDSLAHIIVYTIATDNNLSAPEDLESLGYFNIEEIFPNNNFFIDENGITFTYNEYEIAAYSAGRIDVFLPYEKIRHILRENSPVAPIAFLKK